LQTAVLLIDELGIDSYNIFHVHDLEETTNRNDPSFANGVNELIRNEWLQENSVGYKWGPKTHYVVRKFVESRGKSSTLRGTRMESHPVGQEELDATWVSPRRDPSSDRSSQDD
jgi:hypothetical protein